MLLYLDSHDHLATADLPAKGYSLVASGMFSIGAFGRNSTNGLRQFQNNVNAVVNASLPVWSVSGNVFVMGVAVNMTGSAGLFGWFEIVRAGSPQLAFNIKSTGVIEVRRPSGVAIGTGTLLGTTTTALTAGVWTYVEVKATLHPSAGTVAIKFNGVTDATVNLSGVNTAATGSAGWDQLCLGSVNLWSGSGNTDYTVDFDDRYVCDGSGGSHDDFLGDHRILCVIASSGNGTHTDWTCSTGSDHGALVDEATPNITDYNQSGTAGQRDTYNFAALGVVGTVKAVQTVNYVKADAAGVRQVADTIRISSTDYDGTGQNVASDWSYQLAIHQTSPATATAWTVSEIDGAEFGVKVTV